MKNILVCLFLLLFFTSNVFALEDGVSDTVRLKCKGDTAKKTKNNDVVGDIYVFTIKDSKLYDDEGKLIKNATMTDDIIKGIARYKNGLSVETIKFSINRYSGAFSYDQTYTSNNGRIGKKNTGICEVIKNKKMF